MKTKRATSIRLSDDAKDLLALVAQQLGITQSAVLELAIRAMAKQEGITKPPRRKETHAEV